MSFMKRYPELSLRRPEATSMSRLSGFNKIQVGRFFDVHCVSKNVPPLQLAIIFLHTQFDCDNFGTNVAEKVGHQNVLYFPTSPNQCLCTTCGNRKPGNCVFWLKYCMFFHQKTRNTVIAGAKILSWMLHHCQCKKSFFIYESPLKQVYAISWPSVITYSRALCLYSYCSGTKCAFYFMTYFYAPISTIVSRVL